MTLLTPLALVLGVLAAPIILMYVLKLRRQPLEVSSTLLWRRTLDDVQANAPWQRLRPTPLLLLQLLALAALILTLAQPAYTQSRSYAGDLVIIVDESYGMQAHDVAPSRFAMALNRARQLAGSLGSGHVVSVIGMAAQPHLAIAESTDSGATINAINRLQPTVSAPNFLAALSLASSLARNGEQTRTVVLTSRDSGISALPLTVSFPVDIERIGGALRDVGITAFQASRTGNHISAVLRVSNFGTRPAHSDLNLTVDGNLADVRPLSLGPGQQQTLFWTLSSTTQTLQAHLTRPDDVTQDKNAWAAVDASTQRRVLLVTRGNYFLQTALALDPSVQVATISPSSYQLARGYDLVIFDGVLPPTLPPTPALILAPGKGRMGPIRFSGLWAPHAISIPGGLTGPLASILKYVDLSDVHIARARTVTFPGWLHPLATSGGEPLLLAGDNGSQRLAILPFDLQNSDWPLRISFPVTVHNLLQYLTPGLVANSSTLQAGQPVTFFPQPGTREIVVTSPTRATTALRRPFPPFSDTGRPGLYTARGVGPARPVSITFAVNFFPARTAPAPGPAVVHLGQRQKGGAHAVSVPISVAWVFGLIALAALSAEWWYAFRR